jgi:sialate O-acetylesterase
MKRFAGFLLLLCYTHVFSQLRMSAFFSDHMILQREKPLKIWGAAGSGETVYVNIGTLKGTARADAQGHWIVTLPAFSAGGPYTLMVKSKKETKVFSDVLFGEVWVCSGQSNMQFSVRQSLNAGYEIHRANNPLIRQVIIPNKLSLQPEDFVDSTEWVISSAKTTGNFTAVGYFFARNIFDRLQVPVGLIYDNWGGSQVESWISRDAMKTSDDLKAYEKQIPTGWDKSNARVEKEFSAKIAALNGGNIPDPDEGTVLKNDYSFSGFMPSAAPGDLDWIGLPAYRGEAYMMKEIMVDSILVKLPSVLSLGTNDDRFHFFLNGKSLPNNSDKNVLISFPPDTWKQGKNILLVKIGNQTSPGWGAMGIHGGADMLFVDFDGEKISLADDTWRVLPLLKQPHHFIRWMNNEGTIIYNAMLHPLIPYAIRGVLWYQGESNTDHAQEYGRSFPLLIESWRKEWNDPFPFLYVQLSSYGSNESSNAGSKWAELREAQSKTLSLPNTGMAVTTDVGDAKDVHPKNKREVGYRLAAIALNDVYHVPQTCTGPVFKSVSFSNSVARLSFTSVGKGLLAKSKNADLVGFEIAGPDRKFYYAHARIRGNEIEVSADAVTNPVAVRYGWSDAPVDINFYNADGFPASPFRTDDWPGLTDNAGFYKK